MTPPNVPLSAKAQRTADQPISYYMQLAIENPELISLAAGLVDEESLPVGPVGAALAELFADADAGRTALQYGTTQGLAVLRQQILERFCTADGVSARENNLSPADVVITTGSQQFLYLCGEMLLDPGDIVLTEAPSYFVNHGLLTSHDARIVPVAMDEDGLDVDALEARLQQFDREGELSRVKMIYTVDYFQNPSGRTLSAERRPRLLEIARKYSRHHRLLILEDAAYRELRFEGPDLPSIKKSDTTNEHVIWTSTFSKPCAPGLKTGFGILPAGLTAPLLRIKSNHDFGSNNLMMHLASRLLASGEYDWHVEELRGVYRAKRDAMLTALEDQFGDWPEVRWTRPAGGLYVWITFPEGIDTGPNGKLLSAAMREGVLYVPGQFCHASTDGRPVRSPEARLCFGVATADQIHEAIRRLRLAAEPLRRRASVEARQRAIPVH